MNSLDWLDSFIDSTGALSGSGYFEEAGLDMKYRMQKVKSDLNDLVKRIIAKIQQIVSDLKLKFQQAKFKATVKRLGNDFEKQIRHMDISKELAMIGVSGLKAVEESVVHTQKAMSSWSSGKITEAQLKELLDKIERQFETELGVLYVKLDNLSEDEENGNMVDVMTVLNGYERSVSTLMKTADAASGKTCSLLKTVGDMAARAELNVSANYMHDSYAQKQQTFNNLTRAEKKQLGREAAKADAADRRSKIVANAKAAGNYVATTISKLFSKFTSFISRIFGKVTKFGNRVIAKASNKKTVNESWEESWDEIDRILNDSLQES